MDHNQDELPVGAPSSFDEYEEAYLAYLEEERLIEKQKPAISALELFRRPALPVTSYIPGFVYAGSLNLVAGEPKAGKSTMLLHQMQAVSQGKPFCGVDTVRTNVLYVTEQNEASFRIEAATIRDFTQNGNVYILLPESCPVGSWRERINFWQEKLEATESGILVIDTFSSFAQLPPGGENDSACIADRIMELKVLYKGRPHLAIVLVHHIRKPSSQPGAGPKQFADLRDTRGSTAIVGGVDHCIMVSKAQQFNTRNIHSEGRFEQEQTFQITLLEGGYVLNGPSNRR